MLREFMVHMARRGHFVRVLTQRGIPDDDNEGVRVGVGAKPAQIDALLRGSAYSPRPDILVTHLDRTKEVVRYGNRFGIPVVHLVHNDRQLDWHKVAAAGLVVFNSEWLNEVVAWHGPKVVIHPPLDPARHTTKPGTAVTLVNTTVPKGAEVFYSLAARLPEVAFLAVRGAYGRQVRRPNPPPNVTFMDSTDDAREIWGRTRLVLMPSSYESYGRVGVEAACCGIPTVVTDLPGPREALGDAGTYLPLDDVDAWEATVRRLLTPRGWQAVSKRAKARSVVVARESQAGLELFESELCGLVAAEKAATG
jgi:glycosyltransferase involved in cell wall biosynthesis